MQRYSDGVHHESSKAFLHLVQWFQPDGAQLLEWLRHIFTPHLCLMQWAFGVKDIAAYLGSYMVRILMLSPPLLPFALVPLYHIDP